MTKNNIATIKLNETINKRYALWLLTNINNGKISVSSSRIDNPKEYTIEYCKNIISSKSGINRVTYKQNNNKGRYISINKSLQMLPRVARHTLCKNDYYDIDIVNAQPTILQQYFKSHNLQSPKLNDYLKYRNEVLNGLMDIYNITKDEAKMIFIIILNNGGIARDNAGNTKYDDQFIMDFYSEIKQISGKITKLDENQVLVDEVKEMDKTNITGSVISMRYTMIENEIVQHAKDFF